MRWICVLLACGLLAGCRGPRPRPVTVDPRPPVPVGDSKPALEPARPVDTAVRAERRPPPRDPTPTTTTTPSPDLAQRIAEVNDRLRDVYFDYDRAELSNQATAALDHNERLLAPMLAEFPKLVIVVEGHCDERGSAEYNLALGDRRASRAGDHLHGLGIAAAALRTISYGKEMPVCTEAAEACHSRNRRAHIAVRDDATRPIP